MCVGQSIYIFHISMYGHRRSHKFSILFFFSSSSEFHLSPARMNLNCWKLAIPCFSQLASTAKAVQCKHYCSVRCVTIALDRIFCESVLKYRWPIKLPFNIFYSRTWEWQVCRLFIPLSHFSILLVHYYIHDFTISLICIVAQQISRVNTHAPEIPCLRWPDRESCYALRRMANIFQFYQSFDGT